MYCVKCGVKLADTEKKCPLCETVVFHPDIKQAEKEPLYPIGKMPKRSTGYKALSGALLFLFFIPLSISFIADMSGDRMLEWFGYVAGALFVIYLLVAFPFWFRKPNPIILVPCDFVGIALYLGHINGATGGDWFLTFALPITLGAGMITSAVVTLCWCLKRGIFYILGGATIASGCFMMLVEHLLVQTFHQNYTGWSIYPMVIMALLGGLLIYLGINHVAREILERKLFF